MIDSVRIQRELGLRGRFSDFVRMAWPLIEPGTEYLHNWHIDVVCEHLEAVFRGDVREEVINIPPGCMKSLLTCVFWPVWCWIREPGMRFLFGSFDGSLTLRDSNKALTILQSEWFQERWGDRVSIRTGVAVGDYTNDQGGFRFSTSVGSKATGRHVDIIVVDDPIKPLDISRKSLDKCIEWWRGTMSTRARSLATLRKVLIMQRLHEEDLAGVCIKDGYKLLRLPMRFEEAYPCDGDQRAQDGELLWPARFPEDAVRKLETRDLGPQRAAAQLQQRPAPEGGNVFKRQWFKHWKELPARWDTLIQSWDMTFKKSDNSDYVVGQLWGASGGEFFLIDRVRGRMNFPETLAAFEAFSRKHPKALRKIIEDKANGPAVADMLKKKISGIILVPPEGGKVARANAVSGLYEAGNVYHPSPEICPWVDEHEEELAVFPNGAHDDSVDSATQALNYLHNKKSSFAAAMAAARTGGGLFSSGA